MDYEGIIIAESIVEMDVLAQVEVIERRIEPLGAKHETPWITQWTYLTVRVPEARAGEVAERLSTALDPAHPGAWYADFKNETQHYVVFRGRVFLIDRRNAQQYEEAVRYGIEHGLPAHQTDFVSLIQD